ncbi:hypothetical protein [Aureimonas jatrophae]|jgi:hypothetical protein|uniref:Hydroxyquinol 1,2-dioxygenase n=1 Tax=Aureimonas jatrophae TaxID=1166073 RepID=A0A1H0HUQ4_9HYPH|nr:hypothetical protein [Aureimonas jatrophae]MBB3950790.1 hypothetical protein [Aureimonas jatrophae]SDO22955.1 hypothetical protein SAMN05192530_104297 [Aureimonas jatrophae]
MNRTVFAAAAALLLSTGMTLAADIVPGSDTAVRDQQSSEDWAVASGAYGNRAGAETRFGYPTRNEGVRAPAAATDRADDRAANRTARLPVPTSHGALVPGSDSF